MRVDILKVVVVLLVAGSGDGRPQRDGTRSLPETEVASRNVEGWRATRSADNVRSDSRYTASAENRRKSYISYYRDTISSANERSAKVSSGSRTFVSGSSNSPRSRVKNDRSHILRVSELARKTIPVVYRDDEVDRHADKIRATESKTFARTSFTHDHDPNSKQSMTPTNNGQRSMVRPISDLSTEQDVRSKTSTTVLAESSRYGHVKSGGKNERASVASSIFERSSVQVSPVRFKEDSRTSLFDSHHYSRTRDESRDRQGSVVWAASGRTSMQDSGLTYRNSAPAVLRSTSVTNSNVKVNNIQHRMPMGTSLSQPRTSEFSQSVIPLSFTHDDALRPFSSLKQNTKLSSTNSKPLHNISNTNVEKIHVNDTGPSGARTMTRPSLNENQRSTDESLRAHGRSVPSSDTGKNAVPFGRISVKVTHATQSHPTNRLAERDSVRNVTFTSKGQKGLIAMETKSDRNKITDNVTLSSVMKKDHVNDRSDSRHANRTKSRSGLNSPKSSSLNVNKVAQRRNETGVGQWNGSMVLSSQLKFVPAKGSQIVQHILSTDKGDQGNIILASSIGQNVDRIQSKNVTKTKFHDAPSIQKFGLLSMPGETVTKVSDTDIGQRQDSMRLTPSRKKENAQIVNFSQSGKKNHLNRFHSQHANKTKYHNNSTESNDAITKHRSKNAIGNYTTIKLVSNSQFVLNTSAAQPTFSRNVMGQIYFFPNDSKPISNSEIVRKENLSKDFELKQLNATKSRYDLNSRKPLPMYAVNKVIRGKNDTMLTQKDGTPLSASFLKNWPNGDLHDTEDFYNYEKYILHPDEVTAEEPTFGSIHETPTTFVKNDAVHGDNVHGIHWLKLPTIMAHNSDVHDDAPSGSVTFDPIYESFEPNTPLRPTDDMESGYHNILQHYAQGFGPDRVGIEKHDMNDNQSGSDSSPLSTSSIPSRPYDVDSLKRPSYNPLTQVTQNTVVHILNNGLTRPNVTVTELKDLAPSNKPVPPSQILSPGSATRPNVHIMFTSSKDNSTNSTKPESLPLAFDENCPTITINSFTRVNNTIQSKDGCTDLNIVINSHVLSTNVFRPANDPISSDSEINGDTKDVVGSDENEKYVGDPTQSSHVASTGNYVSPSSSYDVSTGASDPYGPEANKFADASEIDDISFEVFQGTQISITGTQGDESLANLELPSEAPASADNGDEFSNAEGGNDAVGEEVPPSGGSSADGASVGDSSLTGSSLGGSPTGGFSPSGDPSVGSSLGGPSGGSSISSPGQTVGSPGLVEPGVVEGQSNDALAPGSLQLPNLPSLVSKPGQLVNNLGSLQNGPGTGGSFGVSGHNDGDDDDEDDFDLSTSGLVDSVSSAFAYFTILNPFNYGFFSLAVAPFAAVAASFLSFAAFLFPWALPSVFDFGRAADKVTIRFRPSLEEVVRRSVRKYTRLNEWKSRRRKRKR